jgi:hypothetical protein
MDVIRADHGKLIVIVNVHNDGLYVSVSEQHPCLCDIIGGHLINAIHDRPNDHKFALVHVLYCSHDPEPTHPLLQYKRRSRSGYP